MIMIQNDKIISTEILNKLGVYELRELARNIGIPSPTTKKREELCELILKVSTGQHIIEIKKTNKGRPPKSVTKMVSFVNEFIPEDIIKKFQKQPDFDINSNILTFAQNPLAINQYDDENKQVLGYINSINGYLYVKNSKIYNEFKDLVFYIPEDIVQKYSLRKGDKIVANGKISKTYSCGIIDDILKINNVEVKNCLIPRNISDLSTYEIPHKKDTLLGNQIKKGERILTFFNNQEEGIVKILEDLDNSKDKIIVLGLELTPELIYYIKSKKDVESFTTNFYDTLDDSYETLLNSLNHIDTLLKDGKSIKFVIFDIMGILTRLDLYYAKENNCYMGHSISSIQMLKKLIGTGKDNSKDLQVTTISIAFENEKDNEIIKTELEKIFSKIF
ncbi:MAG: hypothetical protein PHS54_04050 [Clostridia bacterium]|nr:hypothetical protein [Clostridia bacterium]